MHQPRTEVELSALLRVAHDTRRKVTFRAGGQSLDDQSLNQDTVIDLGHFNRIIGSNPRARTITVQAGARWGDILDYLLPQGLMPHIVVTTRNATAGGTLSGNCLSRFSPSYGRTGNHVRRFTLATVTGERLECSRRKNKKLFHAVIGGLGLFGAVLDITFDLLAIGTAQNVATIIERREGLASFTQRLREVSRKPGKYAAVSSVFSLSDPLRGAIIRSHFTNATKGKPFAVHQPDAWYRPLVEWLFTSRRISNIASHASFRFLFGATFLDPVRGYTFFMDGNSRAKAIADDLGLTLACIQQTYVIPDRALLSFLKRARALFMVHDVYPNILDTLFLPADEFLLSSSNGLAGFAVSFVFEGLQVTSPRVRACLLALNDLCASVGGRLHLVKSVNAEHAQIQRMYAHALPELRRLKKKYDPNGILENAFFERTLAPA